MKTLERELGTLTFAANQTSTLQLPRNYAFRRLSLKLDAQLTIAAGASAGDPKDSSPAQLIRNITIRANGRDVIKSIDFETLHRLTQWRHGVRPRMLALPAGYGAQANYVCECCALLDFEMWRAIRPIDTLLDSAGLATLELIITWGSPGDVMNAAYVAAGVSIGAGGATLTVSSIESVGVPVGTKFMVNKEYQIRSQVSAASNNHQIILPTGNLYRTIILKTHSDGNQVNTILSNIQIVSGTEVFKNRNAAALQRDNRVDFGLEIPEIRGSGAAKDHYLLEYVMDGYYILEFCGDGHLTEALDTTRLSELKLVLDVAHPGTTDIIDVYPCELIMPAA